MAKETEQGKGFKLEVPLDASAIDDFKPDLEVRVLVVDRAGKKYSKVTKLDSRGAGIAAFEFPSNPGKLQLVLGPENASDDELLNLQTITHQVPANRVTEGVLKLNPVIISSYYW